jgi:ribosomal protein S18 acetylase RimI-like enzyme
MTNLPTDDETKALNSKLLAYLRGAALRRPNHERSGPFLATFTEEDDNPYLNYAIPDDDAEPDAAEIAGLIALFEARKRKPRLEYIAAAAPLVEAALLARGFAVEARLAVMICMRAADVRSTGATGIEIFAASDEEDLTGAEQAQAEAYGGPSHGPAGLRRTIGQGGVVAAARESGGGTIVGAGIAMPPVDGVSEISSIGVRPGFRRRGIAGAMTALLAREAFAAGVSLAWLTPLSRDAERIYARAGFTVASEALHMSR